MDLMDLMDWMDWMDWGLVRVVHEVPPVHLCPTAKITGILKARGRL
jgi:hypothetical protein